MGVRDKLWTWVSVLDDGNAEQANRRSETALSARLIRARPP